MPREGHSEGRTHARNAERLAQSKPAGTQSGPTVVVVGAGIVGASMAFELASAGVDVVVIDAGKHLADTSTSVGFSWVNAADKKPDSYHGFARQALDSWGGFVRRLGDIGLVTWGGDLRWASTAEGAAFLMERASVHNRLGYPIDALDPALISELEPRLRTGTCSCATSAVVEGHVDAGATVSRCLDEVRRLGGTVMSDTVASGFNAAHTAKGCHATSLLTNNGNLEGDAFVVAAGAQTSGLLSALGAAEVPLTASFGATALTTPVDPLFDTVAVVHTDRDAPCRVSVRQLPDGCVMWHGLGPPGRSMGMNDDEVATVRATVIKHFPQLATAAFSLQTCTRFIPRDGYPVVGMAQGTDNVYISVMHNAVTLAPLVAQLATQEILQGRPVQVLEQFRPERF